MFGIPSTRTGAARRLALVAGLAVAAAGAAGALVTARSSAAPSAGDPSAGKPLFVSTCGVCHTLAAAHTSGTLGPGLDGLALSEATIVKAITKGGAAVMSKSAVGQYATTMTGYAGTLTPEQIADIAAFVYASNHATAPAVLKAALTGAGHRPKAGARWKYSVHATVGGKPAAGKVTVQIVDPTGKAHPVQRGTTKKNVTNLPFTGTYKDFVVWPASSRGVPLTLRATVKVGATKTVLTYKVTPRA
jgi:mono/diheme cytochrome c family protein